MDRRSFLASTTWLSLAPAPTLRSGAESAVGPTAGDLAFDAWREAFLARAPEFGLDLDAARNALAGVRADPAVVALDRRQPEFVKPVGAYIGTAAGPDRLEEAARRLADARRWLDPIAGRYRTGPEILVAVWGMETSYGRFLGDDDVVRSLSTLAAEGRRRSFAETELVGALKILASGEASRQTLRGSWAGAMGQTQFTPLDFLAYAVDADGDGRRDIWGSAADALGSTANFLVKKADWLPGGSPQAEAVLPSAGFDYALLEGPGKTVADWTALGVVPAGGPLSPVDLASQARLIAPMGWRGPAFFAFPNHEAIRAYNNSTAYALAVGLLAAGLGGARPIVRPWPEDRPIGLADRMAAQDALRLGGFYAGPSDGLFGVDTRKAARLWQAREGLPADGYLSYDLVQRLKTPAPSTAAPS